MIWERLANSGFSLGKTTVATRQGIAHCVDATAQDGKRFVVHAECMETAMVELERAIRAGKAE